MWRGNFDGGTKSLRTVTSPRQSTYGAYANARSAFFREVQTVNNTVYGGDAFATPSNAVLRGSGVSVPEVERQRTPSAAQSLLRGVALSYRDGGTQPIRPCPPGRSRVPTRPPARCVSKRSTVTVYTSDGSLATTVPDVTGQNVKNATKAISDAGFTAAPTIAGFTAGDGKNECRVASTNPGANASASKDTAIGVTLFGTKDGTDPGDCQ